MTRPGPIDLIADLARDTGQDPAELRVKLELARRLSLRIEDTGATLLELEGLTEIDAEDIAAIIAYDVRVQPLWAIMKLLAATGMDVVVAVEEAGEETGAVYVVDDE